MLAVEWLLVCIATFAVLALGMGCWGIALLWASAIKPVRIVMAVIFIAVTLIVTLTLHVVQGPML